MTIVPPVPILLYHSVSNAPSAASKPYSVTPETFKHHMQLAKEMNFRFLTMHDYVYKKNNDPSSLADFPTALITFDDGYADFIPNALPVLEELEIASTIYVTTGWVEGSTALAARPDDQMLTWDQIAFLSEKGVEIGSHSHTHPHMDTLKLPEALDEIERSKALLQDATGEKVTSFAYPHGYHSKKLCKELKSAGYTSGAAVRNMLSHPQDNDYRLARLMVMNTTSETELRQWLDGTFSQLATNSEKIETKAWRWFRKCRSLTSGKPGTAY